MSKKNFPEPARPRTGAPNKTEQKHPVNRDKTSAPGKRDKLFPREKPTRAPFGTPSPETGQAGEEGLLVPGVKPVLELLQASPSQIDSVFLRKGRHGKDMDLIIDLCRENKVRFSLMTPEAFERTFPGRNQGVAARTFDAGFVDWEDLCDTVMDAPLPLVVALDQVQDPGNAGVLARSIYALGGAGLLIPRHNGVYLGQAAAKSSAGALARLPVAKAANLGNAIDRAAKSGFTIYGAASESANTPAAGNDTLPPSESIFTLVPRFPAILLLGSEESGLRQSLLARCHSLIHIPLLREFDSLNVAQAGGIIVAEMSKHASARKG